jgi:heat shock protein 1/8
MKNTLNEEKLREKFSSDEKKTIEDLSSSTLQWLEGNAEADAEEMEAKYKEVESKFNPIMMKVYQAAGGQGGMPAGMNMPGQGTSNAGASGQDGVDDLD